MKTVLINRSVSNKTFSVSENKSFNRMIGTPIKSRTLREYFGSSIHTLIDKTMDEEWKLLFRKYLFECFFDENNKPWDERLVAKSVDIIDVDTLTGSVIAQINFKDFTVETTMEGF